MNPTVAINQPTYLPWLGYFEQIRQVNIFVFLDSAQFGRSTFDHRNRIKNARDEAFWLTVPVKAAPLETSLCDIEICYQKDWADKHIKSLALNLGKAPYFQEMISVLEPRVRSRPKMLADLNIPLIEDFARAIGLGTKFIRSSNIPWSGTKADLVISILKYLNATHYYSPAGSTYLEDARDKFASENLQFTYQRWQHPTYQQSGDTFISHLSFVDAFCWMGPEGLRKALGCDEPAVFAS